LRVLVVGGTGTIGRAVVEALRAGHEVVVASRSAAERVDVTDAESVRSLFRRVGPVDAVVSTTGAAKFAPFAELTDADFAFSLGNKLMGQVNLVRYGVDAVRDGGSITITSGILAQEPMPGSGAISLVNAALEGFGRAAALEAPRGVRVNVVSPGWVSETLAAMGQDPAGGTPADAVARVYVAAVEGAETGRVLPAVGQR
jgi:NAD(P)-dependent dehydrogenase (short-subunit alcohol dehydrogenase family)